MKASKPRDRAFTVALVISGVLHLSAVSLFSVMIWFPPPNLKFFSFELVRLGSPPDEDAGNGAPSEPAEVPAARKQPLKVRSTDDLFGADRPVPPIDSLDENLAADSWAALPPIDLPKIEFADFDQLRTRQETLQIRSQFNEMFDTQPKDSWAAFSGELQGLAKRLRYGLTGENVTAPERRPVHVSTPAPGFGIYLQWMSPPYDRQLLFSPPVQALWEVDPREVAQAIALAFTVNPQGKVIEVQVPVEDEKGLTSAVGTALLKYRFAPLRDADKNQRATLLLAPESWSTETAAQ